ncbi:ABC transporter ATP-binding protein [Pelagibacterium lacus]|uniref:ABC transporter ATP-binding protein n=1 Tax=Pelagibacterium lacus TaxID=2282655 RepID=A0A369W9N8_9HYPH|nr:ABC transporter ATP-binding protein [Pelagibacterium lacus]RDE10070.1 ABC transporter ATP-binding protein [Pelagibacterium lacus]
MTPHTASGIEIVHLSHAFAGRKVLDDISLSIEEGTSVALLGPNGAGKTTLMNILCALIKPDSGRVMLDGVDLARQPDAIRRRIGAVFQDPSLDTRLTAWENLEFNGLVYGLPRRERARRIDEVLDLVELGDWRDEIVKGFSGGMKRRLEIARALMHQPRILFLDEPTVGLDPQTRARIWSYLEHLRTHRNLTQLITTHYVEEVAGHDRICIIDRGKLLANGTPEELRARHGTSMIRCMPRDAETEAALRAAYPDIRSLAGGRLGVALASPDMLDAFLATYGTRLRQIQIDEPSLETVFLSLTGRELRDRAPGDDTAAGVGEQAI